MTSISKSFEEIEEIVGIQAGKIDLLYGQIEDLYQKLDETRDYFDVVEKVRVFFQNVAEEMQQDIANTICMIATSALYAVFPNPYDCKIRFDIKHNVVEASIYFERNGEEYDPIEDSGGGVIDVASFAIRVAFIFLSNRSRVIIADEPFKNVAKAFLPKIPEMVRLLSDKLGVQFIIVSHIQELIDSADKKIKVVQGEISYE